MFTFCMQKDTIRVEARDFGKEPAVALREEINRRYANKVLPDVGLCISLLDIIDASEGAVLFGDGCFYYKVEFRLVIFRPFIGEALLGKVQSQSEAGITGKHPSLSLISSNFSIGFFDDILITPTLLPDQSAFDITRRGYFWVPPPDDDTPPVPALQSPADARLYIERRDWVRIRVEEELWDDSSPLNGKAPPGGADAPPPVPGAGAGGEVAAAVVVPGRPPYSLVCSMTEPGTGVLDWWAEDEAEENGE